MDRLKAGEGGQAVRLLEESKAMANSALPIAAAYNKAQPATPAADHAEFDSDLRICIDSALAKVRPALLLYTATLYMQCYLKHLYSSVKSE